MTKKFSMSNVHWLLSSQLTIAGLFSILANTPSRSGQSRAHAHDVVRQSTCGEPATKEQIDALHMIGLSGYCCMAKFTRQ